MEVMKDHVDKNIEDDMGSGIVEGVIGMNISQIIDEHEFLLGDILGNFRDYHRNPTVCPLLLVLWQV